MRGRKASVGWNGDEKSKTVLTGGEGEMEVLLREEVGRVGDCRRIAMEGRFGCECGMD